MGRGGTALGRRPDRLGAPGTHARHGGPDSARRIAEAADNWARTAWVRSAMHNGRVSANGSSLAAIPAQGREPVGGRGV